jgi:signal transduction histidine kinase
MSMDEDSAELAGLEGEAESAQPGAAPDDRRGSHLGFVAHEIRNPLSTALWTAELLGRMEAAERGGARGEKLAAMCLRSLQRVRYLVEDHLLTERLDAGTYPIRAEVVSLVDAVVAAEGRRAPGDQPIELALAPEFAVLADRTLLGRLLDTLLDAASQGASTVKVAGSANDGEVVLSVRGALAESRALEDPMKGAASDTRGRALALPTARRVAARMGGRLLARGGAWELTLPEALGDRSDEG